MLGGERVYFPKGSTKVVLVYTDSETGNETRLVFEKVSQCINYCNSKGLDPVISDCEVLGCEEGGLL